MGSIDREHNLGQKGPEILYPEHLSFIESDNELVTALMPLMTPKEVLMQREFGTPTIITPDLFPDFDSLLPQREAIRDLKLLPVKSDEEYIRYHNQVPTELRKMVTSYFEGGDVAFSENAFKYLLPDDLFQGIVWMKNDVTPNEEIVTFISRILQSLDKNEKEVLLFERPLMTSAKYVRGTMPAFRHVHVWLKK